MRVLAGSPEARSSTSPVELLVRLERAREALLDRSVVEIAEVLGRVGALFLDESAPLRKLALHGLPDGSGLSPRMSEVVLNGMAREWTTPALMRLLHTEFADAGALDTFVPRRGGGRQRAVADSPALHITAGNVPGVGITSLIRGLLVKSAVLLKPGAEDRALSGLFLDALAGQDRSIANAAAVIEWDPGHPSTASAIRDAGVVVAYGGDEAIDWARSHIAPSGRLVCYPHRVSAAMLLPEPGQDVPQEIAAAVATATALFDQRGCVSPHTVYVVGDHPAVAQRFAAAVADEMAGLDETLPPGVPQVGESSAFHQAAGTIELEAVQAAGPEVYGVGTRWRVVFEPRPGFRGSCLGRFLWVRPVESVAALATELGPLRTLIQTVGTWGELDAEAVERLARAGVRRIAPIEAAPWPSAWTAHDGTSPLRALVRWVEMDD